LLIVRGVASEIKYRGTGTCSPLKEGHEHRGAKVRLAVGRGVGKDRKLFVFLVEIVHFGAF